MHVTGLVHIPTERPLSADAVTFESAGRKKYDAVSYVAMYKKSQIHKTSHYRVSYDCPTCGAGNTTLLSNLLKKLARNGASTCLACTARAVVAEAKLCKHIPKNKDELLAVLPHTSLMALVESLGDFEYHPCLGCSKHNEPAIQFAGNNQIVRLGNCNAMCQCCTAIFKMKAFKIRRDNQNNPMLVCSECSQTWENKPKRHGDLEYVTKSEHKFIKYCEKNGVPLRNGTRIGHKRIAFYVPALNMYIDVKSNVGWWERTRADAINAPLHINDVVEDSLNAKYLIIYPRNYVAITRTLVKEIGSLPRT